MSSILKIKMYKQQEYKTHTTIGAQKFNDIKILNEK